MTSDYPVLNEETLSGRNLTRFVAAIAPPPVPVPDTPETEPDRKVSADRPEPAAPPRPEPAPPKPAEDRVSSHLDSIFSVPVAPAAAPPPAAETAEPVEERPLEPVAVGEAPAADGRYQLKDWPADAPLW